MRARKPKHIPQRLERYSSVIVQEPERLKGNWISLLYKYASSIELDVGCGKGDFIIESARRNPSTLFIGLDNEDVCIALAAQKLYESGLKNAFLILGNADNLLNYFAFEELSRIHLNFSTPRPKKKHASLRLSYANRLITYAHLLREGGEVILKTDSQPFFDFSLTQFEETGYVMRHLSRDLHASNIVSVRTEYEQRLSELGAKIHYCCAYPGRKQPTVELGQGATRNEHLMSLADYLPHDLESMEYVPYGMQEYVQNQINRRKNLNK